MNEELDQEQVEILSVIEAIRGRYAGKGLGWNRLRGDAIVRTVEHYLQRHLPKHVRLVRNAWVSGCGTEFDLLVIQKQTKLDGFAEVYIQDSVYLTIEVKGAGWFYKQTELEHRLKEWKARLQGESGRPLLYITFWERVKTHQKVLRALGMEDTFVIQLGSEVQFGEWARFVKRTISIISKQL